MREELLVSCAPENFCTVRKALRSFLEPLSLSGEEANLVVLAVDEACANILRHAYSGDCAGSFTVLMETAGEDLIISLRDHGKPCDPDKIRSRALEDYRPGGLGVFFIHQAFDVVEYLPETDGTLLVLRKKLSHPGPESSS